MWETPEETPWWKMNGGCDVQEVGQEKMCKLKASSTCRLIRTNGLIVGGWDFGGSDCLFEKETAETSNNKRRARRCELHSTR